MLNFKTVFTFLTLIVFCLPVNGQTLNRDGHEYFKRGKYRLALAEFNKAGKEVKSKDLLMKRIICNYECNYLDNAKSDISYMLLEKKTPDVLNLYIGKIYHAEGNFKKAADYYKIYLATLKNSDEERPKIIYSIKRCGAGVRNIGYASVGFVENLGNTVNTELDEFGAQQSPNRPNKYYFTSNRKHSKGGLRDEKGQKDAKFGSYPLDMFQSELIDGAWTKVEPLNYLLNTSRHETLIGFNESGSVLFFKKGPTPDQGSLFVDTFKVEKDLAFDLPKFRSPVIAELGDNHLYFHDDSTIVFSSNREGGFGGYDLYLTAYRNGQWIKPKNLGPGVNTAFDEICPTTTKDGQNLYFSSNNLKSMGGFDVFKAEFNYTSQMYMLPSNLGYGINSGQNETHFILSKDGTSANFTSNRKESLGGTDIFICYFNEQIVAQVGTFKDMPFLTKEDIPEKKVAVVSNEKTNITSQPEEPVIAQTEPKKTISPQPKTLGQPTIKETPKETVPETAVEEEPVEEIMEEEVAIAEPKEKTKREPRQKKVKEPKEKKVKEPREKRVKEPREKKVKKEKQPRVKKEKKVKKEEKPIVDSAPEEVKPVKKPKRKSKREYVVGHIQYDDNEDFLLSQNMNTLKILEEILKSNPNAKLELKSYAIPVGLAAYDLYFSIKRAEVIKEYFVDRGISEDRFILHGMGTSYPLTREENAGRKNAMALRLNRRVEVKVFDIDPNYVQIIYDEPIVVDYLRDKRYDLYRTLVDGLTYKVQVAEVNAIFQNRVISLYNDPMVEYDSITGKYVYTLGLYERFSGANKLLQDLSGGSIKNPKIVPYLNGRRMDLDTIIENAEKHPDLKNYIQSATK